MRSIEYRWVILSTGFTVLFFSGGSRYAFGLMLKPMTEDLGWSRSSLSLAVTTFMVVSALAMPLVGRLLDLYGTRMVVGLGAVIAAVGIGLMSRVAAPWQLFTVYGLVYATGHAATNIAPMGILVSRWFPHRRGVATSAAVAGNAAGQLVIIALLAAALSTLGWRTSYAVLGAANLVIVVPLVFAAVRPRLREGPQEAEATEALPVDKGVRSSPLSSVLTSRQMWLLVLVYAICGFQDFFVATHVVAFALDQDLGSLLAGNLLALMGVMGVAGVLLSGVLSDAFGATRPTALCFAVRIGIFALIVWSQSTPVIITFALLYGFTFLITAPLTVIFAQNLFGPSRLGTVTGLINMVHQIAGGLGAYVGATMFDHWGGYNQAFVLMLVIAVVALAGTLQMKERPPLRPQRST